MADLGIDEAVLCMPAQVILFNNVLGEDAQEDAHVFIVLVREWCVCKYMSKILKHANFTSSVLNTLFQTILAGIRLAMRIVSPPT